MVFGNKRGRKSAAKPALIMKVQQAAHLVDKNSRTMVKLSELLASDRLLILVRV